MSKNRNHDILIRKARLEDVNHLAEVEQICFPVEEAATYNVFEERIKYFGNHFHIASIGNTIVGFINGCVTDSRTIQDKLYEDAKQHQENGNYQTVFGLDVLPEYRHSGLAHFLMQTLINQAREEGRTAVILTCKEHLIGFYETLGFHSKGVSSSIHGGALWYDMELNLQEV